MHEDWSGSAWSAGQLHWRTNWTSEQLPHVATQSFIVGTQFGVPIGTSIQLVVTCSVRIGTNANRLVSKSIELDKV